MRQLLGLQRLVAPPVERHARGGVAATAAAAARTRTSRLRPTSLPPAVPQLAAAASSFAMVAAASAAASPLGVVESPRERAGNAVAVAVASASAPAPGVGVVDATAAWRRGYRPGAGAAGAAADPDDPPPHPPNRFTDAFSAVLEQCPDEVARYARCVQRRAGAGAAGGSSGAGGDAGGAKDGDDSDDDPGLARGSCQQEFDAVKDCWRRARRSQRGARPGAGRR